MSNQDELIDSELQLGIIVEPLLNWYQKNARTLPWRKNKNPYCVWVSEIMLQQTRVEAVKPYFMRFMEVLPTIEDLANLPEEQLLKLWEGLGYYSRVRNLQKAAQIICKEYGGRFPNTYQEIIALPGIGEYTAGAVSSISFGLPIPAVDGNVLRVISRLTENDEDITKPAFKKHIKHILELIYPEQYSGDFTQSLMELGATVCLPNGVPKCESCPLNFTCRAYQHGTQMLLPVKAKKEPRRQEYKTILLLHFKNQIAVRKRASTGLLAGLWEFPNIEGALSAEQVEKWLNEHGIVSQSVTESVDKKHIFTHIEWMMSSYIVQCKTMNDEFLWVTEDRLKNDITLPTAFKKFL